MNFFSAVFVQVLASKKNPGSGYGFTWNDGSRFNESGSTTPTFQMLGERNYLPAVFFQPPAASISQGISCHSIIQAFKGTEEWHVSVDKILSMMGTLNKISILKPLVQLILIAISSCILSRKLKSHYGARNRFQEPSLELSSQATWLAGRYDNPMPTWFLVPIAGLKLPTPYSCPVKQLIAWQIYGDGQSLRQN